MEERKTRWQPELVPSVEQRGKRLAVTPMDHLMADSITLMMLDKTPLKHAPDTARQTALVKTRIQRAYAALSPLTREIFANLSIAAMQEELLVAMGNGYRAIGQEDLALEMYQIHIQRRPWEVSGYLGAAELQRRRGEVRRPR